MLPESPRERLTLLVVALGLLLLGMVLAYVPTLYRDWDFAHRLRLYNESLATQPQPQPPPPAK